MFLPKSKGVHVFHTVLGTLGQYEASYFCAQAPRLLAAKGGVTRMHIQGVVIVLRVRYPFPLP